jgi:hypothetical protein
MRLSLRISNKEIISKYIQLRAKLTRSLAEDLAKTVKSVKGKMNGYAALESLPDFRYLAIKTVKPLCGLTAHFDTMERMTGAWNEGTICLPSLPKTRRVFLAVRSKIPPRFPVTQKRAAHMSAARFFPSVGWQA